MTCIGELPFLPIPSRTTFSLSTKASPMFNVPCSRFKVQGSSFQRFSVSGFDAFAPHAQFALAGSMPLFAFGYLHYVPVVSARPLRLGSAF